MNRNLMSTFAGRLFCSSVFLTLLATGELRAQSLPPVVERYEQLLVRSPGKGTAFDKVYQHFFEGEGLEKLAARWQVKADAAEAGAPTYWLLLGVLAERRGQSLEAVRHYQKAVDLKPDDSRAWSALGEAQVSNGKMPEAIKSFQKALANQPPRDLRLSLFRQLARTQQRAFDLEGAVKTWQQFVGEWPDDPFVLEEAADALTEGERYGEAKSYYEKLRDLGGGDPYRRVTAIMKLAQLEEKQGRREESRVLYESALPLAAPASWMHREVRARIEESYRRQDDLPGLVGYYETWLKGHGKDVDVALRLSDALIELNRKNDAVHWLRQASEWAPDRKEVQVTLAKRLGEIDQAAQAVEILKKLTQAHPEEDSFREFLGDAHWQVFKSKKDEAAKQAAIDSWRQLAPATAKDANKVSRVADIFRAHDLTAEALENYGRAVTLAPDAPDLRQRLADYYFELKRDEEGIETMRGLVAGERATAPNFLRLARWMHRRRDVPAASDAVEQGLAMDAANFELMMLKWRLFADTEQWEKAAALFPSLLAAAPSVYSVDQVEDQQVQALRGLGSLEAVSKELAGRIGKTPELTEPDLRLLLRITLQSGDLDAAAEAVADAKQRFPDSAFLVRRQVEFEKRKGNLEGRVAALQRLIQLQPKQKPEWLREIVRAYQDDGSWDKALTAVQAVIDDAPANPDGHVLAADLNFAAQRFDVGVAKLREAIKLSDKPNDLRLRLARVFLEAGRNDESRQTYDAVFEAENDPKVRLTLTRQMAEVYGQQGRLDELIARFRQKQRAEEGGWRYALYLAEIFQQMQDFGAAREELTKAIGARARDGNFLRQLLRLCEAEGNTAEAARFARQLAEVEPSEAHQIDLADALLDNTDMEEVLKVLQANEEAILKNPTSWREVIIKFHRAGDASALFASLRKRLESQTDDWRARFTLAELQLVAKDMAGAEKWLWQILEIPVETPAPPAPGSAVPSASSAMSPALLVGNYPVHIVSGYSHGGYISVGQPSTGLSKYFQRGNRSVMFRQTFAQLLASADSSVFGNRYGRFSSRFTGTPTTTGPATLEEARDAAVIYLASLAQQQSTAESFLQRLEKQLAPASRAERLVAYGLIQARDQLYREIEAEAAQSSGDPELDQYCLQSLIGTTRRDLRAPGGAPREADLIQTFLVRTRPSKQMLSNRISYYQVLTQFGRTDDATKLADEILAQADSAEPNMLPLIFGFAIQREAYETAEKMLPRLTAAGQQQGQSAFRQQTSWYRFSLAAGLLKKKESRPRGVQLLADMLQESYPTRLPGAYASLSSFGRGAYRAAWRDAQPFPFANRYLDDMRIQLWRQVYDQLKAADAMDALKEVLNRQIQSLPEGQGIYSQLARACFWWWDGERGDAISEVYKLAREMKDDDLRVMAAAMLTESNEPKRALEVLEEVSVTTGDLAIDKQLRMLALARKANDLERGKQIVLQLATLRLDYNDQYQLIEALREFGLPEKAEELEKRRSTMRIPGSRNRIEDQLSQQVNAKNEKDSLALARAILARDPISNLRQQGDTYARQRAISALEQFKALDPYRQELERQLAEAPSSVRVVYSLAETYVSNQPEKALGYYRKLVELKPGDTQFQLQLANLMSNGKQADEAMRIWETLLERDPEPLMQNSFHQMLNVFQTNKQMPRLSAALLKMPKRPKLATSIAMYGGGRQDFSSYFNQVAMDLQRDGKIDEAIKIWRLALDYSDDRISGMQWAVVAPLISALLQTGDTQGLDAEVSRLLFPEKKTQSVFAFDANAYNAAGRGWQQFSQGADGRFSLPVMPVLRLMKDAGALKNLRARAAAEIGEDGDKLLLVVIDSCSQDPSVLDSLRKDTMELVRKTSEKKDMMSMNTLMAIAQELREWPEGRRLALDVMLEVRKTGMEMPIAGYEGIFAPQIAELAIELDETALARQVLKDWHEKQGRQNSPNVYGFNPRQQTSSIDLMAKLGMTEEVKEVIQAIKSGPMWKNDIVTRQKVEEYENRVAMLAGQGKVRLAVWSMTPAGADAPTRICWEIGGALKPRRDFPSRGEVTANGEDFPALDGRYEVEIFHGPTPTSMKKLISMPTAAARGIWVSPQSLVGGYVLAMARGPQGTLFSTPAPVLSSANLLENGGFLPAAKTGGTQKPGIPGWLGSAGDSLLVRKGGPAPGGQYVSVPPGGRYGSGAAISQRVHVESAKNYLFEGWARQSPHSGSIQINGHYRDADGKSLGQFYVNTNNLSHWTKAQMRFTKLRNAYGSTQSIPEKAVEIEFIITLNASCDLGEFYFGEWSGDFTATRTDNE